MDAGSTWQAHHDPSFIAQVGMEISVGLFFARYKTVISAIALLIAGKVRGWGQAAMLTTACWGDCSRQ